MTKRAEPSDSVALDAPHDDKKTKTKTNEACALLSAREFSSLDWWNGVHRHFLIDEKARKRGVNTYIVGVHSLAWPNRVMGKFPLTLCRAVIANLRWYLDEMQRGVLIPVENGASLIAETMQKFQDACVEVFNHDAASFGFVNPMDAFLPADFNSLLAESRTTDIEWWKRLSCLFAMLKNKPGVHVDQFVGAVTDLYRNKRETLRAMSLHLTTELTRELRFFIVAPSGAVVVSQPAHTLARIGIVAAELKNACLREFIE